jgi:imidazolonepropionase-like amidohydrolase
MTLKKVGALLGVILCATTMAFTQDAPKGAAAAKPPVRVAIHAGHLLDVRTGNYATNVFILVENDRIVSVGSSAPAGVDVIDLSAQTVLPGLADCHAHILGNWKDQSPTGPLRTSSPM